VSDADLDVNLNDVVAFVVEIAALALLAAAGWELGSSTALRWVLAVGLPVLAAVLWGVYAAPRARVQSPPLRLATQVLVLGGGVAGGFLVLPPAWAVVVAVVVAVNTLLAHVGPLAHRPVS
jgi:hypothetical protein